MSELENKDYFKRSEEKTIDNLLEKTQGDFFTFKKGTDPRRMKNSVKLCIKNTKAVDRFIHNLCDNLRVNQDNKYRQIKKFCLNRLAVNKFIRQKAHEKLDEFKKERDVEWINKK